MSELIIKTHDFESSKKQLKGFSEQSLADLELDMVDISGGFLGLGDHKVTGEELNNITTQIQNYLIDINTLHTKFIKEFGQVYNALDALDKDYMQAFLQSINSSTQANNDVKIAQENIAKAIVVQRKTLLVLKKFKEKIESYEHLDEIDRLWENFLKIDKEISSINSDLKSITSSINEQSQTFKTLNQFKITLEECDYYKDINLLWNKHKTFEQDIISSKDTLKIHEKQINALKESLQEIQEQHNETNQIFTNKLKIAYILAGSSIAIAIIEFILHIL